ELPGELPDKPHPSYLTYVGTKTKKEGDEKFERKNVGLPTNPSRRNRTQLPRTSTPPRMDATNQRRKTTRHNLVGRNHRRDIPPRRELRPLHQRPDRLLQSRIKGRKEIHPPPTIP